MCSNSSFITIRRELGLVASISEIHFLLSWLDERMSGILRVFTDLKFLLPSTFSVLTFKCIARPPLEVPLSYTNSRRPLPLSLLLLENGLQRCIFCTKIKQVASC